MSTKTDFSQRDPRWAGHMLGKSTWETMGGYGCVITAEANIAQAHGHNVTPDDVNNLYKQHSLFVRDPAGQVADRGRSDALSVIFPDIKYVERREWGDRPADIAYFDIRHDLKTDIEVKIDYHPFRVGKQWHWCRVVGTNDAKNDVEVVDSYTGKRIWLSSLGVPASKLIYSAIKFTGPATNAPVPAATPRPAHVETVKPGQWNVRAAPDVNARLRDGYVLGGQRYATENVGGWRKITFRGAVGYVGPKAW